MRRKDDRTFLIFIFINFISLFQCNNSSNLFKHFFIMLTFNTLIFYAIFQKI